MTEDLNKLLSKSEKIESILHTTQSSMFSDFTSMENYLEEAQRTLNDKIQLLQRKKDQIHDDFITTSSVYEMNNKKRQKQQQLLRIQREKIKADLQKQQSRLKVKIHPMTMILKQKKEEIDKLLQTKEIFEDYNRLMKGTDEDMNKILQLDQKNFKASALKIYVLKSILQDIENHQYATGKIRIQKKYSQLKNRIILNFKEGFWKNDQRLILSALPFCEQYQLLDEVSDFYNQQAFSSANKILKVTESNAQSQIKSLFYFLRKGFEFSFALQDKSSRKKNIYQLYTIFGKYSESVARRLVTYVFQKIIKQSLQSILKAQSNAGNYVKFLQIFYKQCKQLIKDTEGLIKDQKIFHLINTYLQSIFDVYLQNYMNKERLNLQVILEDCCSQILNNINLQQMISQPQSSGTNQNSGFTKKFFSDPRIIEEKKIIQSDKLEKMIQSLMKTFMNPSMEKIFSTVKLALKRNNEISRINQMDKNRNQILSMFVNKLGQLIRQLIKAIKTLIPKFDGKTQLHPDFFQLIPQISLLLQRMEYLYQEDRKQAKYQFSDTIKLQQNKQKLLYDCEKLLRQAIGQALMSILSIQNAILKSDEKAYLREDRKNEISSKITVFMQKYLRVINRINLIKYRNNILKSFGNQFINLLIEHYSEINYSKVGLGKLFLDIANYKKLILQIDNKDVQARYLCLKSLIDIYVEENSEKSLSSFIKNGRDSYFKGQKQETIKRYVQNKQRNQKSQ